LSHAVRGALSNAVARQSMRADLTAT